MNSTAKTELKEVEVALKNEIASGDSSLSNVNTILRFFKKNYSNRSIYDLVSDDGFYDELQEALIKELEEKAAKKGKQANRQTIRSRRYYAKELRGMLGGILEKRSGTLSGAKKTLHIPSSTEINYDEIGKLPFWDAFERLVEHFMPDCIRPPGYSRGRFNVKRVAEKLGQNHLTLRNSWSSRRPLRQKTLDSYRSAFAKYDRSIPSSIFSSGVLAHKDCGQGVKRQTVSLGVDELPDDLARAISAYVEFRKNPRRPRNKDYDTLEIPTKAWKDGAATEGKLLSGVKRFVGFLTGHRSSPISVGDIDACCMINQAYLEEYLDWREQELPDSVETTLRDLVSLTDIAKPEGWYMITHARHMSGEEKRDFHEFYLREVKRARREAERRRQAKHDERGFEAGKRNAPWFFGASSSAQEGMEIVKSVIETLETNYTRNGTSRHLVASTWLAMEAELPLRISNTTSIVLGDRGCVAKNIEKRLATIYRNAGQWHLYVPKSILKNSGSSHVRDIEWTYSKHLTKKIDRLVSMQELTTGEFLFSGTLGLAITRSTKEALASIFPDCDYPGMNPHVMRHIVATYRVNVLKQDAALVASVLMDKVETVLSTYFSNDHVGNLKAAQADCAAIWAA